jgi:ribonucleoside-triphosphate reductase
MIEKPHSFATACNIATQAIAQIASSQYGGQSISLSHLAPFVQISREKFRRQVKEELEIAGINASEEKVNEIAEIRVKEEINRGVQMIQYQVITLMTTNGQAPFITVFMYLDEVPEGQMRDDLALMIEEMLNQRIKGVKNEKGVYITPAFPKLIYVLDEDNIHEDSKYWYLTKLAAKCTAKRMVPDYISAKVMKELKGGNVYTCMGCRSFLTYEPDVRTADGKPKFYGRFNQGVVTINLVDVACTSGGEKEKFWKILDERLDLCYRALMIRHNRLKGTPSDVAPILWQYGALARLKKGEVIDKLLYNGYSTISLGYAGLCECTRYMTGRSHTDPTATPFALEVMQKLNDACKKWREETNIAFSLYGTPLESTTYKFAKALQKRFGVITGVTDKNYITNSYHVHVTEKIDAFEKLKFESQFQALSPGGAISYVEVPNMQNNLDAVLTVMQYIYDNIMYAELNTKSDYCQCCGYDGEIQIIQDEDGKLLWECPNCGNTDQDKMNVARRTCGYIGTQFWNQGRTQEIKERVLHL